MIPGPLSYRGFRETGPRIGVLTGPGRIGRDRVTTLLEGENQTQLEHQGEDK